MESSVTVAFLDSDAITLDEVEGAERTFRLPEVMRTVPARLSASAANDGTANANIAARTSSTLQSFFMVFFMLYTSFSDASFASCGLSIAQLSRICTLQIPAAKEGCDAAGKCWAENKHSA